MDDDCTGSDVVQVAPGTVGDRHEASNQSRASFLRHHVPEEMEVEVELELRIRRSPSPRPKAL